MSLDPLKIRLVPQCDAIIPRPRSHWRDARAAMRLPACHRPPAQIPRRRSVNFLFPSFPARARSIAAFGQQQQLEKEKHPEHMLLGKTSTPTSEAITSSEMGDSDTPYCIIAQSSQRKLLCPSTLFGYALFWGPFVLQARLQPVTCSWPPSVLLGSPLLKHGMTIWAPPLAPRPRSL